MLSFVFFWIGVCIALVGGLYLMLRDRIADAIGPGRHTSVRMARLHARILCIGFALISLGGFISNLDWGELAFGMAVVALIGWFAFAPRVALAEARRLYALRPGYCPWCGGWLGRDQHHQECDHCGKDLESLAKPAADHSPGM